MINTKPLIKFLLWTFTLSLVCIIGASNIFAAELSSMKFIGRSFNQYPFSTNYDPSTYNADYFTFNGADTLPNYAVLTTCGTGPLSFNISNSTGNFSYIDYVSLSNNTCTTQGYQGNQYIYYFKFNKWVDAGNGNFGVSFNNTVSNKFDYNTFVTYNDIKFTDSINLEELKQQQQIIEQNNQNTNNIINNQNQNNENLIDSNTQNTQDIINNNDENTNKIIDENKKNFNDCHDSVNLIDMSYLTTQTISGVTITNNNGIITLNGTSTSAISMRVSNYLHNFELGNYSYSLNSSGSASRNWSSIIYGRPTGQNSTNLYQYNNTTGGGSFNLSTQYDEYYLWFYFNPNTTFTNYQIKPMLAKGNTQLDYEPYGEEICVNKLDEQKNAINNVDNTLKDDSVDDNGVADAFESFNDYLDDNSTITQLITLPITLYTAILNNLNGTCSPFNLGELYGESLILPCINISQYLGNSLWTMIDIIISGFAVYAISKKMIKVFNNFSSLREGDVIDD